MSVHVWLLWSDCFQKVSNFLVCRGDNFLNDILKLSNTYLADALSKYEIDQKLTIHVSIKKNADNKVVLPDKQQQAKWKDDEYGAAPVGFFQILVRQPYLPELEEIEIKKL